LDRVCGDKLKDVLEAQTVWNAWNWREEMMRMLDSVQPELVVAHDEDEVIEDEVLNDIKEFRSSRQKQLALAYSHPMPTEDSCELGLKAFPSKPHVMVVKWRPRLKFHPYMSRNRITQYGKEYMLGNAKILHYCYYTEELRRLKMETQSHKNKLEWAKKFS
jgi:hypothetical protein